MNIKMLKHIAVHLYVFQKLNLNPSNHRLLVNRHTRCLCHLGNCLISECLRRERARMWVKYLYKQYKSKNVWSNWWRSVKDSVMCSLIVPRINPTRKVYMNIARTKCLSTKKVNFELLKIRGTLILFLEPWQLENWSLKLIIGGQRRFREKRK